MQTTDSPPNVLWLQRHSLPQVWPEGFDDMLDSIDLCDNIDGLRFHHEWAEEWFVEFKFCNHTLSFRAIDDGNGYGPFEGYSVYALNTSEDVMFWIACELAARLAKKVTVADQATASK